MAAPHPVRGLRASTRLRVAAPALLFARKADVQRHCASVASRLTPEHVHDLRVALRRLRGAARLFGAREDTRLAISELDRLQRALGGLRDVQVQLAGLSKLRRSVPEAEALVVAHVRRALEATRALRAEQARRALRRWTKRGRKALGGIQDLRPKGRLGGHRLRRRLGRQLETLEERAGAALAEPGRDCMHALRTTVRRFRYALEFLEPAMPLECAEIRAELVPLQSALGELHDLDILIALVDEHSAAASLPVASELLQRLQSERERLAAELQAALTHWEEEASALRAQVLLGSSPVQPAKSRRKVAA